MKEGVEKIKGLTALVGRYKYVLLLLAVGLLLLLWPMERGEQAASGTGADPPGISFDLEAMEEKCAAALSRIEGAGAAHVTLTLRAGTRQVLAQDTRAGQDSEERSTVVVSQGTGHQAPVVLQEVYPVLQGAVVTCPGGDNPAVKLKLTEAMSALTGLGSDKISISKGGLQG